MLAEKTPLSSQYFYDLQKFIVIERGLVLLPVASPTEAGKTLAQMVSRVFVLSQLADQHSVGDEFGKMEKFGKNSGGMVV